MKQSLTSKQRFWRDHIVAAQRGQLTYAEYAKQHSLNIKSLYNWSMTLRHKGLLEQAESAFVELKVDSASPTRSAVSRTEAHVRLVNGVELALTGVNEQTLRWLASL